MKLVLRRKRKRPFPNRDVHPLEEQTRPNEVWSMDFMSDSLIDKRRIRVFNVIDDYNIEALMCEVGNSFPANRVIRILERLIAAATNDFYPVLRSFDFFLILTRVHFWVLSSPAFLFYL